MGSQITAHRLAADFIHLQAVLRSYGDLQVMGISLVYNRLID